MNQIIDKTFNLFPGISHYGTPFAKSDLLHELIEECKDDWSPIHAVPGSISDVDTYIILIRPVLQEPQPFKQDLLEMLGEANDWLEKCIHSYLDNHDLALVQDRGLDVLCWNGLGVSSEVKPFEGESQIHCLINISNTYAPIGFPLIDDHVALEPGDALICPAQFPFTMTLESDEGLVMRGCLRKYIR